MDMLINKKTLLTSLVLAAPLSAFAYGHGRDGGGRDGYGYGYGDNPTVDLSGFAGFNYQTLDDGVNAVKPSGTDLGLRGKVFLGSGLFVAGEYTYSDVDDQFAGSRVRYQTDEYRLGGGILVPLSPQFKFGGYGDYVDQKVDTSYQGVTTNGEASGYDVGVLAQFDASPRVQTYARIGYMSLEPNNNSGNGGSGNQRFDGVDLLAGLSYRLTRELSLFGEYRYTNLEDQSSKNEYSSVRGGLRLRF